MRLIDADALEERMEERLAQLRALYGDHDQYKEGFEGGMKSVEFAPTLTVDDLRPHGRWLHRNNGIAYCSECDTDSVEDGTNFCPECGADMRGGGEDG